MKANVFSMPVQAWLVDFVRCILFVVIILKAQVKLEVSEKSSVCVIFRDCRECWPTCSRDFEPSGQEWKTCIYSTSMLHIGLLVSTSIISVKVFLMSLWRLCHSDAVRYYLCQWFWTKPSETWTNKHVFQGTLLCQLLSKRARCRPGDISSFNENGCISL